MIRTVNQDSKDKACDTNSSKQEGELYAFLSALGGKA